MSGSVIPCVECGRNTWAVGPCICDRCKEGLTLDIDDSEAEYYNRDKYDQVAVLMKILDEEKNPYIAFDKIAAALDVVRAKLGEAMNVDDKQERDALIAYQRFIIRHLATAVQEFGLVASTGWDANVVLRGKEPELS